MKAKILKTVKKQLKKYKLIRNLFFLIFHNMTNFFKFRPILMIEKYIWFFTQLKKFNKMEQNNHFKSLEYYPCLFDNTTYTPVDPVYFYQDTWFAKNIFQLKPTHHYDVGSSVKTMAIISQFVPVTMIDIRPIEVKLPNFYFIKGSILELPFEDNSIESLSSLCVVEHVGLGRYGDELDPFGSEKAIKELKRVLKINGILFLSVPVDSENKVYFNAHRAFTRDYLLELFDGFTIEEEKYIYGFEIQDYYDPSKGFGTGLFRLRKRGI